jgi:Short repeat of unknown function (DUF308)
VTYGRRTTGLLSIAAGIVIIVWPEPGLVAVAIILGAWLIVTGTLAITGAFAARGLLPNWWLLLIVGLLEIALGVLPLANPGATLAALITVAGIWAVVFGVMRVVLAFEIKRLPDDVDHALAAPVGNGLARDPQGRSGTRPHLITSSNTVDKEHNHESLLRPLLDHIPGRRARRRSKREPTTTRCRSRTATPPRPSASCRPCRRAAQEGAAPGARRPSPARPNQPQPEEGIQRDDSYSNRRRCACRR